MHYLDLTKEQSETLYNIKNNIDLRKTLNKENLKEAYKVGLIPKSELKDRCYYIGSCRNSNIAVWDAKENVFWYLRSKWGTVFKESINHPEDDNGYDLFLPIAKCKNPPEREIVYLDGK